MFNNNGFVEERNAWDFVTFVQFNVFYSKKIYFVIKKHQSLGLKTFLKTLLNFCLIHCVLMKTIEKFLKTQFSSDTIAFSQTDFIEKMTYVVYIREKIKTLQS